MLAEVDGFPKRSLRQHRAMLSGIDRETVFDLADVSGMDPDLLMAAHQKWGCTLHLVDLSSRGTLGDTSDWPEVLRAALIAQGVPAEDIGIVRDTAQLKHYDVVTALGRFGVGTKVKGLADLLRNRLAPDARVLVDIRKGSGGYPFLKSFGNCTLLDRWANNGVQVDRVFMAVEPTETADTKWGEIATRLIGDTGFYHENDRHSMTYVPRGKTLCVTFDNLDIAMDKREDRRPWGFKFIEDQGWSMLAAMANGWTWYRDPWVTDQFDRLRDSDFFAQFDRVIFYGASMGGYGALVFSSACPGAEVVVFSPQTVIDKRIVPWETRYRVAWDLDYSDHYGDAASTTAAARRVNLFYDPYSDLDARHIARLSGPNLVHLRCPFFGHRLGSMLQQMGVLRPLVLSAMAGELTETDFRSTLRQRRHFRRYRKELIDRLLDRGRERWAADLCRSFLRDGPDRFFLSTLNRLEGAATAADR